MKGLSLVSLFLLLISHPGFSAPNYITFPSDIDWTVLESTHFRAIYRRGQETLAKKVLDAGERAHQLLRSIFPDAPDKTWAVVADFHDSTNGYALDFPYPHMVLYLSPPESTGQLASLDRWIDSLVLHEYVHILHLYPANGFWKFMRAIFGSIIVPNGLMPSHFHEGLAVLLETEMSHGGRGRGSHFKMYQRKAVEAGVWNPDQFMSADRRDGVPSLWPQGASAYFFGHLFYDELWNRKKGKGIYDFVLTTSSNLPYLVSSSLKTVYGEGYEDIWKSVYTRTTKTSQTELTKIKNENPPPLTYLTDTRFNKWDLTLSPDQKKIAYRSTHPREGSHLEVLDLVSKKKETLLTTQAAAEGLCWTTDQGGTLFYVDTDSHRDYVTNRLAAYDIKTKTRSEVRENKNPVEHIHQLDCGIGSALTYIERAGEGAIVEYALEFRDSWKAIEKRRWKTPEGVWVSGLLTGSSDWILIREGTQTHFYEWNKHAPSPLKRFSLEGHFFDPQRSKVAGEINVIGSIDGRDEVWAIQPTLARLRKLFALTGGASSFVQTSDRVYLTSYEHGGYDLAVTSEKPLPARNYPAKQPETPAAVSNEKYTATNYSAWSTLFPRTWIPSLLIVPDGFQVGAWIPGFDVSQRHTYNLFGGYDSRGMAFADASYSHRFGGRWNFDTDIYLSPSYFISTKDFLKQWGASFGFGVFPTDSNFKISVGPVFQRTESSRLGPAQQSVGTNVRFGYSWGFEQRPASVSPQAGTRTQLSYSDFRQALGSSDDYFTVTAAVDKYIGAPWYSNHGFLFSGRMGWSEGSPFYNSFYQGGGELLFSQGRGFFNNRGFIPGLFAGRRMATFTAEYRFPLFDLERGIGLLPFRLRRMHASFVADTLTFDFGKPHATETPFLSRNHLFSNFYTSAGLELKSDWMFFFYLPALVRLGFYHGFGEFGEPLYFVFGMEASL